jgi:histidinol-phosphate/aromatic aminotransferase/cobyric acid decarboxylase-like protein
MVRGFDSDHHQSFALDHCFGGNESARDAIASFFNTYFQPTIPLGIEHIVLTTGAGPCIEAISQALCEEGDAVIVPAPYWCEFHQLVTPEHSLRLAKIVSNPIYTSDLKSTLFLREPPPSTVTLRMCFQQSWQFTMHSMIHLESKP